MERTLLVGFALAALVATNAIGQTGPNGAGGTSTKPSTLEAMNAPTNTSIVTEAQVRANLLSTGFTRVDGLKKGSDGNWHAVGTKGDVHMSVDLDPYGRILSRF